MPIPAQRDAEVSRAALASWFATTLGADGEVRVGEFRGPGATGSVEGVSARCSRPTCGRPAVATLMYDYAARTATVDDLAPSHPMQYDLCDAHAERLSVPNGWTMVDRRIGPVVDLHGAIAS